MAALFLKQSMHSVSVTHSLSRLSAPLGNAGTPQPTQTCSRHHARYAFQLASLATKLPPAPRSALKSGTACSRRSLSFTHNPTQPAMKKATRISSPPVTTAALNMRGCFLPTPTGHNRADVFGRHPVQLGDVTTGPAGADQFDRPHHLGNGQFVLRGPAITSHESPIGIR